MSAAATPVVRRTMGTTCRGKLSLHALGLDLPRQEQEGRIRVGIRRGPRVKPLRRCARQGFAPFRDEQAEQIVPAGTGAEKIDRSRRVRCRGGGATAGRRRFLNRSDS